MSSSWANVCVPPASLASASLHSGCRMSVGRWSASTSARHPVGAEEIEVRPHHGHAHRMAEERHAVELEVDEHVAEISGEPMEPVPAGGLARSSVAAMVDADHLEPRRELVGDGEELLGGLGPARQADDRRTGAGTPSTQCRRRAKREP